MPKRKRLSIIIPVYNEGKTIEELLRRVRKVKLAQVDKEIIVVDDGSTDETRKKIKRNKKIKIIYHSHNQGKGAAVRTGLRHVSGDYILIQDADLEYDPRDIAKLLKPIQERKAQVVYGSRFTGERRNMLFWHMTGNRFLSLLTNLLYNTTLSDIEVCYKLFSRDSLKAISLKENRWGFDPEITAKVLKKGIRIYEVPISYAGREYSEGKKIKWQDGLIIFWAIIKYRFFN